VAINYIGYRIEKSLALRANTINYLGDTVRGSGLLLAIVIPSLDLPIATLLFTFLAYEVYRLLRETTSVLMDESPTDLTLKIMEALRETKEVKRNKKNPYQVDRKHLPRRPHISPRPKLYTRRSTQNFGDN